MSREKIWIVSVIVAISSTVICMASMFFSYRVYVSSRKLVAEYRNDLFALRQSYAELEKQFTNIAKKKKIQNKPVKTQFSHSPLKDPPITLESGDGSTTDHRKKVQQIAQIISSTGLDQLAVNEDLDPTILTKIYEDYALRDLVSNYREQVLSRNRDLLQLDRNQYHEELMDIYDRARLRRRGEGNADDQEKAFNELLTKYPEAYATGMAIAERALRSAFMRKSNDVEEYYSMLRENDKFSNIATDRGTEAMPMFQNRYKSILCQEDIYLLELVRYIHLNPLRAKIVKSPTEFEKYPYSGHSVLMGKVKREFQDTGYVLRLFGEKLPAARKAYRAYVEKGIAQGRKPELVGGGLIRSAGGWSEVKAMRRAKDHMKSDERILGDGDFAQYALDEARERLEERFELKAQGYDLDQVTIRVSTELGIDPEQVWKPGKHPITVKARSLLCYWAVRKLGFGATELSKKLGISQPSVSISVKRGEKIAEAEKLELVKFGKL